MGKGQRPVDAATAGRVGEGNTSQGHPPPPLPPLPSPPLQLPRPSTLPTQEDPEVWLSLLGPGELRGEASVLPGETSVPIILRVCVQVYLNVCDSV